MLKLIWVITKFTFLTTTILILGQVIRWRGTTVSDHVQTGIAHAEKTIWFQKASNHLTKVKEEILPSEQEKLRALVKELSK